MDELFNQLDIQIEGLKLIIYFENVFMKEMCFNFRSGRNKSQPGTTDLEANPCHYIQAPGTSDKSRRPNVHVLASVDESSYRPESEISHPEEEADVALGLNQEEYRPLMVRQNNLKYFQQVLFFN